MNPLFFVGRCALCGRPGALVCPACDARVRPPVVSVFDPTCELCGQARLAEASVCVDCVSTPGPFERLDGWTPYQAAGGELLRLYKAGTRADLAPWFAARAAVLVDPPGPLVPVPPLRAHLWERGWDPVDRWAGALGTLLGQPVVRCLRRRPSASQKLLDREGRQANAAAAYGARSSAGRLAGRSVWLLDDVVTTGATAAACARLLYAAGAFEVRVLCLGLH